MSSNEPNTPLDVLLANYFSDDEISYLLPLLVKWAGSEEEVISWFQEQPIPAFGNRTGLDMCKSNQSKCFIEYVQTIEFGAFA